MAALAARRGWQEAVARADATATGHASGEAVLVATRPSPAPFLKTRHGMASRGKSVMAKGDTSGGVRAMETWLAPFAALFTQPTWLNAVALATGALLCLNRRTVCSALRAVDGASDKGFSRFHRFLSRGVWSGLQGSRILLGLLVKAFVPDGQALVVGVDDSIERRRGEMIRDKGLYRDPVRSSRGFFVKVEGLRWLSFHLLGKPQYGSHSAFHPHICCRQEGEQAPWVDPRPNCHRACVSAITSASA